MFNKLDAELVTPWLVIHLVGQWALLALLVTYGVVKHLPQRNNPFLINVVLTHFLATIPPALRLYAGVQYSVQPSNEFCLIQASLVDGVSPMFGIAQLALVFDTWSEMRSLCLHKRHITRLPITKYLLILAPYAVMLIWALSSFIVGMESNANHYTGSVWCINSSVPSGKLSQTVGEFLFTIAGTQLFFELWVGWMIYSYPTRVQKDPMAWRTTIQFALRIIIFQSLQLIATLLSVVNAAGVNSPRLKAAYQLLSGMAALATFIAFGTQKSVLKAWKFWARKTPDDQHEIQPQGYPPLDWADVPRRQPLQFDGDAFEREEKGLPTQRYLKSWLRLGKK